MIGERIESIVAYIIEIEEQLYEWDDGHINWHCELETLQKIIKFLMKKTFASTDSGEKTWLASLEYKARQCRNCILRRCMMKN